MLLAHAEKGIVAQLSYDKTMADKLIYFPNDKIQNFYFCRLQLVVEDIQLNEPTNQNLINFLIIAEPTDKRTLLY